MLGASPGPRVLLDEPVEYAVTLLTHPVLPITASYRSAREARSTSDQQSRILCCDLAIQDDNVVLAHAQSELILGGRHNTVFSSAFMARVPVEAQRISAIEIVEASAYALPVVDVRLNSLIPL
jgi:hypothetical protein